MDIQKLRTPERINKYIASLNKKIASNNIAILHIAAEVGNAPDQSVMIKILNGSTKNPSTRSLGSIAWGVDKIIENSKKNKGK